MVREKISIFELVSSTRRDRFCRLSV